ncbi:MAG: hypothetical protein NXI04_22315 [Planctomycetaceae bacterium]|nr:hypothetical protein [Planctomycetaceae bacterium]
MTHTLLLLAAILPFAGESPEAGDAPTFADDVAAIIHRRCSSCHRPGSSAPFSLLTYQDVSRHADTIVVVLEDGYMPPWKPVDHGIAFANSRRLPDAEQRILREWVNAGSPEGDPTKTPLPPEFSGSWKLGPPDMVVKMNGRFQVPADGPDIYRSFVFPVQLPEDKWVKAVELRPRATSAVHHAIFFVDTTGNARKLDGADGRAGLTGMGFLADFGGNTETSSPDGRPRPRGLLQGGKLLQRLRGNSDRDAQATQVSSALRGLGGYVPGSTPNRLPGDLAMSLPQGSDIVMQTHFHPSGRVETEQAELALYFADRPPSREIVPIMVPPMFGFGADLKVPAGEANYRLTDSITLPVDTLAVGVTGHAHYICRAMKLTATLPDGRSVVLLQIDDWDLDWQDQYQFSQPLSLPAGTVLRSDIVYDNSADNPRNPHHPPQEIRWGRGSADEMGSMTLTTIALRKEDERRLQAGMRQHIVSRLVDRSSDDLVRMLMQLDDDGDGILLGAEIPPRMTGRTFRMIDANNDGGLEKSELSRALQLRDQFRRNRQR